MVNRHLKILHTPFVVAGNPSNLAWGERQIGLKSELIYFERSKFDSTRADDHFWNPHGNLLIELLMKSFLVIYAILTKDIIHFNNGSTLFPLPKIILPEEKFSKKVLKILFNASIGKFHNLDLKLFKLFSKKVFITFQGSDARLHNYHLQNYKFTHCQVIGASSLETKKDELKIQHIHELGKYVNQIFAVNPDILHTLPKNSVFLPYSNVNISEWKQEPIRPKVQKIVHAPSKMDVKGTKYILSAVERMKAEGIEFDFELIHGVPQTKMRKLLASADIIIDQLLVGWYGGLAVEAMSLGLPVICYIREEDLKHIPSEMKEECPIINATPDTIYDVMKSCLKISQEDFKDLQNKSRGFVDKWHDPVKIAEITNSFYLK